MDLEIREQREAFEMITQGEGNPTTSISILASTSEPVGIFTLPLHPSTIAATSGIVFVSHE